MTSCVTTLTEISQFPTYIYLRFRNYNCITFSSCFIITVPVSKNFIHQPIQKRHNSTLSYQNTQVIDIIIMKCIMSLWVLRLMIFWDVMLHPQVTIWRNVLPSLTHWHSHPRPINLHYAFDDGTHHGLVACSTSTRAWSWCLNVSLTVGLPLLVPLGTVVPLVLPIRATVEPRRS